MIRSPPLEVTKKKQAHKIKLDGHLADHQRDYSRTPYEGYEISPDIYFPVPQQDKRYHRKERVLGLEVNGVFKAYPFSELRKHGATVKDEINGQIFRIEYDKKSRSAKAFDSSGEKKEAVTLFWFAWYGFHPETKVWERP